MCAEIIKMDIERYEDRLHALMMEFSAEAEAESGRLEDQGASDERARCIAHILCDIDGLDDPQEVEGENGTTEMVCYSEDQIRFGKMLLNNLLVTIQETDWWPAAEYVQAAGVLLGKKPGEA